MPRIMLSRPGPAESTNKHTMPQCETACLTVSVCVCVRVRIWGFDFSVNDFKTSARALCELEI